MWPFRHIAPLPAPPIRKDKLPDYTVTRNGYGKYRVNVRYSGIRTIPVGDFYDTLEAAEKKIMFMIEYEEKSKYHIVAEYYIE